jgi:uncharacterized protein YukE
VTRAPLSNFAAHSHEELVRMLRAGEVSAVREAGDAWRRASRSLVELADSVQAELLRFSPMWRGGAADQYKIMMIEFVEGVDTSAELVASVRDLVHSAADALQRAQREMPAAVAVPQLGGVASVLAHGPSTSATALWDSLAPDQQGAVAEELRRHQGASAAAGAAHSAAVAIMTELAVHYLEVEDSVPALPVAAEPPPVPSDTTAASSVETSLSETDSPIPGTAFATVAGPLGAPGAGQVTAGDPDGPGPSLFGDMYAAGALAASAAVLGRFRLGVNWLQQRRQARADATGTAGAGAAGTGGAGPPTGSASTPVPGGTGGGVGGGGVGGGGVIGGTAVDLPEANPALTGGVLGAAGAAGAAAGLVPPGSVAVAGAGAGTGSGMGMGMVPPMVPPMGGAEGAGMQRRIPPWLVETEPVFGESVPVTPAVIGAEPEDPRPRRPFA